MIRSDYKILFHHFFTGVHIDHGGKNIVIFIPYRRFRSSLEKNMDYRRII